MKTARKSRLFALVTATLFGLLAAGQALAGYSTTSTHTQTSCDRSSPVCTRTTYTVLIWVDMNGNLQETLLGVQIETFANPYYRTQVQ